MMRWWCSLLLLCSLPVWSANQLLALRAWPAKDYTRITIEAKQALKYKTSVMQNPQRVVVEINNIKMSKSLQNLADKLAQDDPYIKQLRIGQYDSHVVRVVADLKVPANPKIFMLKPVGSYYYRLVLDVYPVADDVSALIQTNQSIDNDIPADKLAQASSISETATPMLTPTQADEQALLATLSSTHPQADNKTTIELAPEVSPAVRETVGGSLALRKIRIAIDAGHGGEDSGARGAGGSYEKNVTLAIARRLKDSLDDDNELEGILVRDGDYFIPLRGRVIKARKQKADVFVSIHADSFKKRTARGSSVFVLSEHGATSASARYLANKENESDLIGGVSLDDKDPILAKTLLELTQTATINDSLKLGSAVLLALKDANTLHTGRVEQAGFAVLKSPDIPSILVETAFISNPEEEARLNDEAYQQKLVSAIVAGIKRYLAESTFLMVRADGR